MTLRVAGHPLHAMLTHFPLALLFTGAGCDAASWVRPDVALVARFAIAAGLATALPAALVGMVDWAALGEDQRVQSVAIRHISFVSSALAPFAASLWFRESAATAIDLALDALGCALLSVGAWHGGELVYGHSVGTRDHAAERPLSDARGSRRPPAAG